MCGAYVGYNTDIFYGKREAAQEFGAIAELTLNDFGHAVPSGERRSFEGVAQRGEENLTGLGEFAAEHEQLRVE